MNMLRNRFLNTASALLAAPNDEGKKPVGKPTVLNEDVGAEDDGAAAGGADAGAEAGQDADDAGDGAGDDGDLDADADADADADTDAGSDDDDPDLADLPPEVKAKVKGVIEKKVARETGWRDRQIDRLHAKRRAAEEDVMTAASIVGQRPATSAADDPDRKFTSAEVKTEAQRLAAQEQYDRDCNAAFAKGQDTYGDKWNGALNKLPKLGGVDVDSMVDIMATDQPHVVLFSLTDPEIYERVMALPPARRRNEFVKLSLKSAPKAAARESQRPAADQARPVRPLQGGRRVAAQTVDLHDDKVADDAWYAERNKTRRKKFANVS